MSKNHWGVRNESRNTSSDEHRKMGQRRAQGIDAIDFMESFQSFL